MNTLIFYSINVLVLSLVVLVVGMFKPKWILLWMQTPKRIHVLVMISALLVISYSLYLFGNSEYFNDRYQPFKQAVLKNKISAGMTVDQVLSEAGKPIRVNHEFSGTSHNEIWLYSDNSQSYGMIEIQDGKVVSFNMVE
jgi:hypothetical protein